MEEENKNMQVPEKKKSDSSIRKLNKRDWLIIALTFVVMASITGYAYYRLQKTREEVSTRPQTTGTSVTSPTFDEPTNTDITVSSGESTTNVIDWADSLSEDQLASYEEGVDYDPVDDNQTNPYLTDTYIYDVVDDVNANNEHIDADTFSIDGVIVDFPLNFNTLEELFSDKNIHLPMIHYEGYIGDVIVNDQVEVCITPASGEGIVSFMFSPVDGNPTELKNCTCKFVSLASYMLQSQQTHNMTISLEGNVRFGDTYDTVKDKFPHEAYSYSDGDESFSIYYDTDQATYLFLGSAGGLAQVIIEFK